MSSSFDVPDSISFGDLEKLAAEAPKEEPKKEGPYAGYTAETLQDMVADKLQEISDLCPHPLAHKVAMHMILDNMLEWHIAVAMKQFGDNEPESGGGWMRDAGKFQAIHNILSTISICNNDFTCRQDDEE